MTEEGSHAPRARRPTQEGSHAPRAGGPSFFRSRWVEAPVHAGELPETELPAGFRAAGVAAGIKPEGLDVGVLVSDSPATVSAARFTTNARVGAPVIVSRLADLGGLRAVAANSGCSNVGDGQRGLDTAAEMQSAAAAKLGLEPSCVAVASTGVIGMELPRERVVGGIESACDGLGLDAADFSEAILTSDSGPKRACLQVHLSRGAVRLAAQAKGAGMISPRFATMFCFVQTDAVVEPDTLELLTGVCVKRSFDRISVDGQLSTSDTVIAMAGGHSGARVEPESDDELRLGEALDALLRQLALDIVADGEGARRVGRVVVEGDPEAVEPVARSVANSPLVKTALHGGDPNFGRILQAAGQAWPGGEPFIADLDIEGRQVVSAGEAVIEAAELPALAELVQRDEVEYAITLPGEGGETEVFFSDLSSAYVDYNAGYTS
jgi:glutamate N-acetyltransferase/amino-acid N-acetyltransferase